MIGLTKKQHDSIFGIVKGNIVRPDNFGVGDPLLTVKEVLPDNQVILTNHEKDFGPIETSRLSRPFLPMIFKLPFFLFINLFRRKSNG